MANVRAVASTTSLSSGVTSGRFKGLSQPTVKGSVVDQNMRLWHAELEW